MSERWEAPMASILVFDDDGTFRIVLARALRPRGHEATTDESYDEAIGHALADPPPYVVVDLQMPGALASN